MAEFARFRTAIGGFNRSDVVNYIESAAKAHQTEKLNLRKELAALREEKAQLEQQLAAYTSGEPMPKPEPLPDISSSAEELEAYRRAEATERLAEERAEKIRDKMSALCDKAASEYAGSLEKVQSAQTEVEQTIQKLRQAMQELETKLQATKESFKTANEE